MAPPRAAPSVMPRAALIVSVVRLHQSDRHSDRHHAWLAGQAPVLAPSGLVGDVAPLIALVIVVGDHAATGPPNALGRLVASLPGYDVCPNGAALRDNVHYPAEDARSGRPVGANLSHTRAKRPGSSARRDIMPRNRRRRFRPVAASASKQ
jgi:hypothetical protein